MRKLRSTRARLLRTLTVDAVVILGVVLLLAVPATTVARPERVPKVPPPDLSNASEPNLTVDPPSYWMRNGANVTLRAFWAGGSALCSVAPLWFSWEVSGENATGLLNATRGPSVSFVAESFVSGAVNVTVRSEAVLACGTNQSVLEGTSRSSVSVVVPLAVTGVTLSSYLLSPGANATLDGRVTGGTPPYELNITWGDGTGTAISLATPASFSARHTFSSGDFVPRVVGHDAEGGLVNVSVPEAVSAENGYRVTIVPQRYVVPVGTAAEFSGEVLDAPSRSVVLFACSNGSQGPSNSSSSNPNTTTFSCTFDSAGTAEVLFGSYSTYPGGPSASTVLYETVVSPPEVAVAPGPAHGEAGSSVPVPIDLSGGALPVSLSWNLTGNRSSGTEVVDADGPGVLALSLDVPGAYSLGLRAIDALGQLGTNDTLLVDIDPPLNASADGASSISSSGAVVRVTGSVVAGCPPFSWWIVPAMTGSNLTIGAGTLGAAGGFAWNGTYLREGSLSVTVVAADSCGSSWQTALTEALIPAMEGQISVAPGPLAPNETVSVNVSVQGGWPPFRLWVNASNDDSWNGTILFEGPTYWLFRTSGNGTITVRASVTDALGSRAVVVESVVLRPWPTAPSSPPSSSSNASVPLENATDPSAADVASLVMAFLVPAGAAVAGGVVWRHRVRRKSRGSGSSPGPDPEATLRRIIEPADGAERFTVEMLATEAGVSLPVVRSTIERLVSEGKVCSETGADGEEVLSWSESGR